MSATSSGGESGGIVCLPLLAQVISKRPFSQQWARKQHTFMEGGTQGPAWCWEKEMKTLI